MSERPTHWPGTFDEFRSHRTLVLDRLAVDSVLWDIESYACDVPNERGVFAEPLAVGGERTVTS